MQVVFKHELAMCMHDSQLGLPMQATLARSLGFVEVHAMADEQGQAGVTSKALLVRSWYMRRTSREPSGLGVTKMTRQSLG